MPEITEIHRAINDALAGSFLAYRQGGGPSRLADVIEQRRKLLAVRRPILAENGRAAWPKVQSG